MAARDRIQPHLAPTPLRSYALDALVASVHDDFAKAKAVDIPKIATSIFFMRGMLSRPPEPQRRLIVPRAAA